MLFKGAAGALLDWKTFSSCIISARTSKVLIVQCYVPTKCYGRLQAVVDQNAKKDLLIMMGDFNAKIGNDNRKRASHGEGLGNINENRELFTDFCHFN